SQKSCSGRFHRAEGDKTLLILLRFGAPGQKSHRKHGRGVVHQVSEQLRFDKLVVREVTVERMDHPFAPAVDAGVSGHVFVGIDVTQEIQPVTRSEERRVGKECRAWWWQYHDE